MLRRLTARRAAAAAVLAATCGAAVSGCASGPNAANTPAGSGTRYVAGQAGSNTYKQGSRPAAPAVSGTTLSGSKLSLSAYRGKVVVLNFWGSWCAPCIAEAQTLAALSGRYASRGVRFVGVDIRDSPANAEAFMHTHGITYPSLNDPGDQIALTFRAAVPPAGIPTTLVIDPSGHIAGRIIGEATYPALNSMLSSVTSEAA
jgi:peroxiredoxin